MIKNRWFIIGVVALLYLFLTTYARAQTSPPTQVVKKFAGESTTFTWEYDLADEPLVTHFSLRHVDDLTKTTIELKTVPITLRTTSISASFTPSMKFTYYNVYAVKVVSATVKEDGLPSNTVATERIGRPPRNLVGQ